jgi:threonine dehydratase
MLSNDSVAAVAGGAVGTAVPDGYHRFPFTLDDALRAREVVSARLAPTPIVSHPLLDRLLGCKAFVKLENTQGIGSFKIRGGLNLLASMTEGERERGLVTATRGNHGQSLAQAAGMYGARCTIFVPRGNNPDKNAAMDALGATVIEEGHDYDAAMAAAEAFARETGGRLVHPSREPELMAGIASVALEMIEQVGEPLDAVFVPVGGGSIAAAMSVVLRALSPSTQVIGVQSENAPAMHHAWHTGEDRPFAATRSIADGLAVRVPVDVTLSVLRPLLHSMVLVSEEEIQAAIRTYATTIHQMAEGAGAVPLAAAVKLADEYRGKRVGLVLTGGNIESRTLMAALAGERPPHRPQAMPMYPIDELSYGY